MKRTSLDLELVNEIQNGNKQAFNPLVVKYQPKVFRLIVSYIKDIHEAHDITQDVFIKAYSALNKFRGESAFYTWLYRIAINAAKNHLVNKGRRLPGIDAEWYQSEQWAARQNVKENESPERLAMRDEMQESIDKVLEQLPKELRLAFVLREMGGLTYDEIADVMHCPLGTVRSRIFRAREAIEKILVDYLNPDI